MFWMIVGYAKSYLDKCSRDHIGAYAAQAAYFLIMSAIPFLMLLTAMIRVIPSSSEYVYLIVYDEVPDLLLPYVERFMGALLGFSWGAISITAVLAIWAAGKAFQNLMVGLNVINQIKETRNWLVTRFWSVVYTFLILIAIVALMLFLVFTESLKGLLKDSYGLIPYLVRVRPVFRLFFVFIILVVLFTAIFKALPNKKLSFISQLPGGVLCALSWYVFSAILAVWVRFFNGFSMYGNLATIVMLMVWLYFCMYFMLMCAEANAFFEQAFGMLMRKWWGSVTDRRKMKKEKCHERQATGN